MTILIPSRIRQPSKSSLQTFSNVSKFRKSYDIGIWMKFCPACRFLERWNRRKFPSLLSWKQVCCRTWRTRRRIALLPLKCFCTRMTKITGVLILDIFGLYNGYIVWLAMGYLFTVCSWTVEEVREVFALLLQLPKFNPAEMLAVPTYNTIRHCSRSFRETLRTEQSLRLRSSQSLERALTPISKNVIAARLQFQCCM